MGLSSEIKKLKLNNDEYFNSLIIVKSGRFYRAYDVDAEILGYVLEYKLLEEKDGTKYMGFPESALDKNINKLETEKINYYVYENLEDLRAPKQKKKFGNHNKYEHKELESKNYVSKLDSIEELNTLIEKAKDQPYFDDLIKEIKYIIKKREFEELEKNWRK